MLPPRHCGAFLFRKRKKQAGEFINVGEFPGLFGKRGQTRQTPFSDTAVYGSRKVWLQEAPQTSALFLFGSVASVQFVLGFPLAAGSR
jgi:hypothetical protein